MTAPSFIVFDDAIEEIGLDRAGLRVEGFRTDGTSNYLANLNFRGQTWAAALRLPAKGGDIAEFISEKRHALIAVDYLLSVLGQGIDIDADCVLKFDGKSTFVEARSTQSFLRDQSMSEPLVLTDNVNARRKEIVGAAYPDSLPEDVRSYIEGYGGPFYLSRGAPAWETLEEYPELERQVAHAIAKLHMLTGSGSPVPLNIAEVILAEMQRHLKEQASRWQPATGSKEEAALVKASAKWNPNQEVERALVVRSERFLRTNAGRSTCRAIFEELVQRYSVPGTALRSFCHGDCNGGNFIIVRFLYDVLSEPPALLDRVFLNDIFDANSHLDKIGIEISARGQRIIFERGEASTMRLVASRRPHHEVHLIDLDGARGTTKQDKELHLYDAIVYAMSLENLTCLFAEEVPARSVLGHYYEALS